MCMPSLSVPGLSDSFLGLPLCTLQADNLTKLCSPDLSSGMWKFTSVEHAQQLNSTQFSIRNEEWSDRVQALLHKVEAKLGYDLSQRDVSCELHKLLLLEPGGSFKVSVL